MGSNNDKHHSNNSFRAGLPFKRGRNLAAGMMRTATACILLVSMVTTAFYLILKDPRTSEWPFQKFCAGKDILALAKEQGVWFPKLDLGFIGSRRGVIAKDSISAGEVVVRVPFSALFNYPNAGFGLEQRAGEGALRQIWREFPMLPEVDRLTIALLYEASQPSSRWDFYLCAVPRPADLGPPVLWEEERLAAACSGREHALCPWVDIRKAFYADWWVRRQRLRARLSPLFPPGAFTLQNFVWAAAAVNSRMWNMHPKTADKPTEFRPDASLAGSPQWVLAPVAELLNHQPGAGHIQWNSNWDMEVVSDKEVKAGHEVFLSYGDKCNLTLLLEYGFALPHNSEWCDDRDPADIEAQHSAAQQQPEQAGGGGAGAGANGGEGSDGGGGARELRKGRGKDGRLERVGVDSKTVLGPPGPGRGEGKGGMEGREREDVVSSGSSGEETEASVEHDALAGGPRGSETDGSSESADDER